MRYTVTTKLNVPEPVTTLVQRPQLMQLLNQGLRRQLTLIAALAGYGKTTTVAMWVCTLNGGSSTVAGAETQPEVKTAWYALDAEDNEFITFFSRFAAALEVAMPGALRAVPTGLAIQQLPLLQYANVLAEACLALPYDTVLVLDDYHVITAPEIHTVLTHLVHYASGRLRLVVVTRYNPPLPISRLRAQQQVLEVRADELRLTDVEAATLLALRLARTPSEEVVSVLQARAEGWVAGLQLAAAALDQESVETFLDNLRRDDGILVQDFLFDEVLNHVPDDVRAFLLTTALLARFNVELAATVTRFEAAVCGQVLDQLRQRNLFLVVLDRKCCGPKSMCCAGPGSSTR